MADEPEDKAPWEDISEALTPIERPQPPQPLHVITYDTEAPKFADVNHWHPVVDWIAYEAATRQAKVIGVKISQSGMLSRGSLETVRQAEQRGFTVLGYNYGCAFPDKFLQYFPPKANRIPVLDFEGTTATLANAERFIRTLSVAWGRPPWFYARADWIACGQPENTEVARCPYWGPQYGIHLVVPRGVGRPVAWQFTDGQICPSGGPMSFPGVGHCDINMLIISPDELRVSCA